jgi:hypothetical protein
MKFVEERLAWIVQGYKLGYLTNSEVAQRLRALADQIESGVFER